MSVIESMSVVERIETGLESFLRAQVASSATSVRVLGQIPGGASRMTYRIALSGDDGEQSAILRMIPESGGFTSAGMAKEVEIFRALADTGIPVPVLLHWSDDAEWVGAPFVIVEEVTDCESALEALFRPPFDSVRNQIGNRIWSMLGTLASVDPVELRLIDAADAPAPEDVWRLELDYVRSCLAADGCESDPLAQFLVQWLEGHVPPPGRLSIVHGDYRPGNFLFDSSGDVPLVMDWELWRLGDATSDLVYSIRSTWSSADGEPVIPVDEAIAIWEAGSGRKLDPQSRRWYEVAERAAGFGTLARMRDEYFRTGGREPLTYFLTLRSLSSSWERLRDLVELPSPTVQRPAAQSHSNESAAGERLAEYARLSSDRFRSVVKDAIPDEHLRSASAVDGLILRVVADRLENSAQLLVDDNAEIESVLASAVELLAPGALRSALTEALSTGSASLRISDLEMRNRALCTQLIALQRAVAESPRPWHPDMDRRVRQAISNRAARFVLPLETFS